MKQSRSVHTSWLRGQETAIGNQIKEERRKLNVKQETGLKRNMSGSLRADKAGWSGSKVAAGKLDGNRKDGLVRSRMIRERQIEEYPTSQYTLTNIPHWQLCPLYIQKWIFKLQLKYVYYPECFQLLVLDAVVKRNSTKWYDNKITSTCLCYHQWESRSRKYDDITMNHIKWLAFCCITLLLSPFVLELHFCIYKIGCHTCSPAA